MRFTRERFREELLREVHIALEANGGIAPAGLARSKGGSFSLAPLAAPKGAPSDDARSIPSAFPEVAEG
jgi:hypothetical protein